MGADESLGFVEYGSRGMGSRIRRDAKLINPMFAPNRKSVRIQYLQCLVIF